MLDVVYFHLNYSYFRSVFAHCSGFPMKYRFTFQLRLKWMDFKSKQSLLNDDISKGF